MEVLFWVCAFFLFYAFFGYPLALKAWALVCPRKHRIDEYHQPTVSIVLSVYNEEDVIKEKVENFFSIDYPKDRIEFVIVSDQCSDRTEEIIRSFNNERIKLIVQENRSGKTLNLNRGVAEAQGEIIVFTDANSMFDVKAIQKLVRHFADARIGLVSGRSVYLDSTDNNEVIGGAFRSYEEMIKRAESQVGSIVGADGAIYALRKVLYKPLIPKYINDFIHTIQVVQADCRAISDSEAICREVVDEQYGDELGRQTRMMAQSWLILFSQIGMLFKLRKFLYLWEFVSHKLLRWLTLPLLILILVANCFIYELNIVFLFLIFAQCFFYLSVFFGVLSRGQRFRFPYLFMLVHYACLLGLLRFFSGNIYTTWSPRNN